MIETKIISLKGLEGPLKEVSLENLILVKIDMLGNSIRIEIIKINWVVSFVEVQSI